jgi:hypothetical protein
MATISKKKAKSNREKKAQKQARQIRRQAQKRNRTKCFGKKLTTEQKEIRSHKLATRRAYKEKRRQPCPKEQATPIIKRCQKCISKIISTENLDLLARSTGFIKRKGEITAFAFIYIVSFGFLGNGKIALSYLVGGLSTHFSIFVSPQALSKRINSKSSPKFLESVFQQLLGAQMEIGLKNKISKVFSMFDRILLQDSTQVALNEHLSDDFIGQGGGASKSALKLDFIYDVVNYIVCAVKMTSATVNDQTNAKNILEYLTRNSLVIRDLGYFSIDCIKQINAKGCYYLSRLSISANIYMDKASNEPLNILEYLKEHIAKDNTVINIDVYVGKVERMKTRLIVQKLPKDVMAQRAARYKKERKKEPSPFYTEWCGYAIFITNIPEEMCSDNLIVTLYRMRWQIEIVFKSLKSNIEIDYLKGTNKNRIECLVYGRLIAVVMTFIIHNYAANIVENEEVSGDKLVKLLMSDNRLREAVIQNDLTMLLIELEHDILLVCKQKRIRKTILEQIKEAIENPSKEPFSSQVSKSTPGGSIIKSVLLEAV